MTYISRSYFKLSIPSLDTGEKPILQASAKSTARTLISK
ncbi:hypothetical protein WZ342_2607 [Enterococcus faecalis]|nr:hypothetical protein WZ342_2607 [Enterococcus faecalis]